MALKTKSRYKISFDWSLGQILVYDLQAFHVLHDAH